MIFGIPVSGFEKKVKKLFRSVGFGEDGERWKYKDHGKLLADGCWCPNNELAKSRKGDTFGPE